MLFIQRFNVHKALFKQEKVTYSTKKKSTHYKVLNPTNMLQHDTYLSGKPIEKRIPEVHKSESEVFVEEITEEFAHSNVRPASVDEQQAL